MPFKTGILAAIVILIGSSVFAGDLFLLKIDSYEQLAMAQTEIEFAHGLIGDRFLVELENDRAEFLQGRGLELELAVSGFSPDNYALATPVFPSPTRDEGPTGAIYSKNNSSIIQVNIRSIDALRRDGYSVVSLADLKTPLFYNPPLVGIQNLTDVPSDDLADLIEQDSLYAYDTRLEDFVTRYCYSDSIYAARDWIMQKFLSFGYSDVTTDNFGYPTGNVICVKQGTTQPNSVIVVGAHYDSYNTQNDPYEFAPGADDNGSGTAAVLEMARALSQIDTKKTIVFAAFNAEEVGLVGSDFMASQYAAMGVNVEFMLNLDMVAYNESSSPYVTLFYGVFDGYAQTIADAYNRLGELTPNMGGYAANSDHASFLNYGYYGVYVQEGTFNYDGWHTNIDISSRLDFDYFTKLVRGTIASLGFVDNAAAFTDIESIQDHGDGQTLRIIWQDCYPDYTYQVLYGTTSGDYTNTVDVPAGQCYLDISGLQTNVDYYFAVKGTTADGYGPIGLLESSERPMIEPRPPSGFTANPDSARVLLSWSLSNNELDFSHYRIHRKIVSNGEWVTIMDNYQQTDYIDESAVPQTMYDYKVTALDFDLNESADSDVGTAASATFDGGVLLVDQFDTRGFNPTNEAVAEYYDEIFQGIPFDKFSIGPYHDSSVVSRSVIGQYNTIYWLDDDWTSNLLEYSADSLSWFFDYQTNFFAAGYYTLYWLAGSVVHSPGDFIYDYFGIVQVQQSSDVPFVTAEGVDGWPDMSVDPSAGLGSALYDVAVLDLLPQAEVIYTFKSSTGSSYKDGLPIGVAYETDGVRTFALTIPLYYMNRSEVNNMLLKAQQEFGGIGYMPGDFDGNNWVNILDIISFVKYFYHSEPGPDNLNVLDVDGDCDIDMEDIIYLVYYKYASGPAPIPGCVE